MANQPPIGSDWRRPWQQQLGSQRHLEKAMIAGAVDANQDGVTAQQRRRFQRIEFIKTIAFVIGSVIAIFVLLTIFGVLFNR